ncbi:cupin domain-containing protein [Nocardia vermiculata]|uniref:Cupin domain-containing protein n=1 Tax=Nocardia vermiculata TaxID=257274 RepID=A0A846XR92_9NOCA|nr:cupin domain-containing protein [Nocardia vermiculata]NKY48642.1 cupin domain-containing protein [Nocardia vermiculata]
MPTIDLFARGIRLLPGGEVFDEQRRMTGDMDGWTLAAFQVATDADVHGDYWEMHPGGDELVTVLSGGIRLFLRDEPVTQPVRVGAGEAFIVPRGRWHRIELDEPSRLMSLTLRRGTELEKREV